MEETIRTEEPQPVETVEETFENAPADVLNEAATAQTEPETDTDTAEEAVEQEPKKLLAGKYESIEELEKGYGESIKYVNELRKEIDEHKMQLQEKAEIEKKFELEKAKAQGFHSVEELQIAQKVQLAEFDFYANNLHMISQEDLPNVQELLNTYYTTANKAYLNEAKKYFSDDVIEQCAVQKLEYQKQLEFEHNSIKEAQAKEHYASLIKDIEETHKEFLSDLDSNKAKSEAIAAMFNIGAIQSREDMDAFVKLHDSISKQAVENYIAEEKAQKVLEETKEKAVIPTGSGEFVGNEDKCPTYAQISTMSQDDYNKAVEKWGLEKILKAK